jgi:poly(hydroxyalkanoate) granule-associated protein
MAKLKSSAKAKGQAKQAGPAPSADSLQSKAEHLSRSIMDSAQQIWLAGMGAFGRAQEEGTKMFEALVSEGLTLEKRTRKLATGRVDAVRDAVESRVGQVKERASDTWDRLEKVFEERVQRALVRLGVPGREELQALIERVDRLNAELRRIAAKPAPVAAATRPAAAAAKPSAPRAPARKRATPTVVSKSAPAVRKAAAKRNAAASISDATD